MAFFSLCLWWLFAEPKLFKNSFPLSGHNNVPLDFLLKVLNISFHTEAFNLPKMVLCLHCKIHLFSPTRKTSCVSSSSRTGLFPHCSVMPPDTTHFSQAPGCAQLVPSHRLTCLLLHHRPWKACSTDSVSTLTHLHTVSTLIPIKEACWTLISSTSLVDSYTSFLLPNRNSNRGHPCSRL